MIIIGITGAIGHGKTTLANAFEDSMPNALHLEIGDLVCEVANKMNKKLLPVPFKFDYVFINNWLQYLPDILSKTTHTICTYKELALKGARNDSDFSVHNNLFEYLNKLQNNPNLSKTDITADNKEQYRDFLQWLGGYLIVKINPDIWSTEIIRRLTKSTISLGIIGGIRYIDDAECIRKAGGLIIQIHRSDTKERDIADDTESQRSLIRSNTTIENNSSIKDLKLCAKIILSDILSGNLLKKYDCKTIGLGR